MRAPGRAIATMVVGPRAFSRTRSRNGRGADAPRPLLVLACAILLLTVGDHAAAASRIAELRGVAEAGAPALALSLLDRAQPAVADDAQAWSRFERERIAMLGATGAWQRAVDRLARTPDQAPAGFRRWARERRAAFHLELGQAAAASELLRGLLWDDGRATAEQIERWRRLVIRAHLAAGRVDDAVVALRRFEQDYGGGSDDWAALRTRVLLRAGRAEEAAARLPDDRDGELAALGLLARVRAGEVELPAAYRRCAEAVGVEGVAPESAARWWFIAAEIGQRQGDLGRRALATERAQARAAALPPGDALFALDGDALWAAWLDFGRQVGNDEQLLIGDDDAWFGAAEQAMPASPVRARALLALVAQQGSGDTRQRAHRTLLRHLEQGPGLAVGRQAYLASERYGGPEAVPVGVRYRLVDDALARDDIDLASRLLSGLAQAPPGVEPFAWNLMRARVLVRGERYAEGAGVLAQVIGAHAGLKGERLDRLLQVVFDLQGAGEHRRALALLERVGWPGLPVQRQRELLYWRAESHQGLEQYRQAAAVYLRSALLMPDSEENSEAIPGADPWGQTARYQAAGMLAEAGLVGDARRIYRDLLRTTDDADRRATLRHRLRQLPSADAAPDDLPADSRPE